MVVCQSGYRFILLTAAILIFMYMRINVMDRIGRYKIYALNKVPGIKGIPRAGEYSDISWLTEREGENEVTYHDEEDINGCLRRYGIEKEKVLEYQEYAIYDVILRTWVEANGGIYWLEKLKLQWCTVDAV